MAIFGNTIRLRRRRTRSSRRGMTFSSTGNLSRRNRASISTRSIRPMSRSSPRSRSPGPRMWMPPFRLRAALTTMSGARCRGASGRSISFASRACCRIARGSLPWRRRSMAGSRSRSRATSMCRWRRRISSITRAGRTSWTTWRRAAGWRRWAWWARSSRGIFRCSWARGKSRPRWRWAIAWCSSRRRPRRSPA